MHRHGARSIRLYQGLGLVECGVNRIGLRRYCQVHHALRQREFSFRASKALKYFRGVQRHAQGTRVSQPDVFTGHAHQAARQIARIGAAIEHAHQPVKGSVRVRTTHRLVQRADGVKELITALVIAAHALAKYFQ